MRGRGDEAVCFTILSFCGRDWWAGHRPIERVAPRISAPVVLAAAVLRRLICDECQQCPMWRAKELRRCAGCRAVYYCRPAHVGEGSSCQLEAWGEHKVECNAAKQARLAAASS